MGQGLFDEVDEYAAVERDVDAILGYSLRELCLRDTENRLKETQYTQPALYVVNALYYYKAVAEGLRPAYLAGHSVGEYNALLAAGVFDFLTGLRMVKRRGELMSLAKNGGMGAVIGLESGEVAKLIDREGMTSVDIASFNSPSQTVISGPTEDIKRAGRCFEERGARLFILLQVSGAFHSRYMTDAGQALNESLRLVQLATPQIPVVANATGQFYPSIDACEGARSLLVEQMTHPVRWAQSIRFLIDRGVKQFSEVGPGSVLANLAREIQQHERQLVEAKAV